jgi:hypothetical protein
VTFSEAMLMALVSSEIVASNALRPERSIGLAVATPALRTGRGAAPAAGSAATARSG